jgi:hypothetical protein
VGRTSIGLGINLNSENYLEIEENLKIWRSTFLRPRGLERFKNIMIFKRMFENFIVVKISQVSKFQRDASSLLLQN